jgi:gliding motility-associated-like protein
MFEVTLPGASGYYWNYLQDTNSYYYPGQRVSLDSTPIFDSVYIKYIEGTINELYAIGITYDGCVEMDTLFIIDRLEIDTLYNVFTPNHDGINDTWKIPNAEQYPEIEVQIFNRWGQLIYYRKGYGDASDAYWDGTSMKNGKDLPMGTYLFVITPNDGETQPITGTVTIIR